MTEIAITCPRNLDFVWKKFWTNEVSIFIVTKFLQNLNVIFILTQDIMQFQQLMTNKLD
jgi:hypothetical protein